MVQEFGEVICISDGVEGRDRIGESFWSYLVFCMGLISTVERVEALLFWTIRFLCTRDVLDKTGYDIPAHPLPLLR